MFIILITILSGGLAPTWGGIRCAIIVSRVRLVPYKMVGIGRGSAMRESRFKCHIGQFTKYSASWQ